MPRIPTHAPPATYPDMGEALDNRYAGTADADSLRIRDYGRILVRRGWLIVAMIVAGLLAASYYNRTALTIYEAWATLQIEVDPNVLGLDQPLVEQRDWMREYLPTQLAILESRELASMAREQVTNPTRSNPIGAGVADGSNAGPGDPLPPDKIPSVSEIVESRIVADVRNTRLVRIGFRSADSVSSAAVANALARAYVKWNFEFKTNTTGEASDWLARQVEEQRKVVAASEGALQRYREQHGADALRTMPTISNAAVGERQNIVVQKLAELQAAVTNARGETIEKEAEYRQLASIQASRQAVDTLPLIASNPYLMALKGELTGLQQKLELTSEKLGERHPELIRLRGAVESADQKLQAEMAKVSVGIRNEYETALARERGLIAALERQKTEVQELNAKAVEYTALEGEARANRELLDKLVQRSRQIRLARDLPTANARLLDAAEVPSLPIRPRKQRNLIIAFAGSAALGLGLVFLLEIFNTRVSSPDDVTRHLQLPVLGVAPRVKSTNGHGTLLLDDGAPPQFAELLHSLRTSLVLAPELAASRTLLVTSARPGEGKTLAAANVAISLAGLNHRVLLIDADLRKPRLHEVFRVDQRPGLTDVLKGQATHGAIHETKVPRLWLIPSGNPSRHAADLLGSQRFSQLIECFRQQFDWIVLDSPPVLPVTDACLMTRVASGVLFVVESGKTSRDIARAAVERLDAVGANLVGALLNGAELGKRGESYLPYYHRDYDGYYSSVPLERSSWIPHVPGPPSNGDGAAAATSAVQTTSAGNTAPDSSGGATVLKSDAAASRESDASTGRRLPP
jgi:polysaccharide biosynthesis transport protein